MRCSNKNTHILYIYISIIDNFSWERNNQFELHVSSLYNHHIVSIWIWHQLRVSAKPDCPCETIVSSTRKVQVNKSTYLPSTKTRWFKKKTMTSFSTYINVTARCVWVTKEYDMKVYESKTQTRKVFKQIGISWYLDISSCWKNMFQISERRCTEDRFVPAKFRCRSLQ